MITPRSFARRAWSWDSADSGNYSSLSAIQRRMHTSISHSVIPPNPSCLKRPVAWLAERPSNLSRANLELMRQTSEGHRLRPLEPLTIHTVARILAALIQKTPGWMVVAVQLYPPTFRRTMRFCWKRLRYPMEGLSHQMIAMRSPSRRHFALFTAEPWIILPLDELWLFLLFSQLHGPMMLKSFCSRALTQAL